MASPSEYGEISLLGKGATNEDVMKDMDFLLSSEDVRSQVRELRIPIEGSIVPLAFLRGIEGLLQPDQLPNLQRIWIGGDQSTHREGCEDDYDGSYAFERLNQFRTYLLRLTHQLDSQKPLDVSLDRFVFTLDSPLARPTDADTLDLTQFDHLTSLSVTLFDPPGYWGPGPRYTNGSISQRVAEILTHHHRLRHVTLDLIGSVETFADEPCFHPNYEDEKLHALENISPAHMPALESFELRGEFVLSNVAWAQWQHCDWDRMNSLVLREDFTKDQFVGRLESILTPEKLARLVRKEP